MPNIMAHPGSGGPWEWRHLGVVDPRRGGPWERRPLGMAASHPNMPYLSFSSTHQSPVKFHMEFLKSTHPLSTSSKTERKMCTKLKYSGSINSSISQTCIHT